MALRRILEEPVKEEIVTILDAWAQTQRNHRTGESFELVFVKTSSGVFTGYLYKVEESILVPGVRVVIGYKTHGQYKNIEYVKPLMGDLPTSTPVQHPDDDLPF